MLQDINVGDRVKSFDFPGVDDCYAIGVIEEIGPFEFGDCDHYKIKVEKYILNGEEYSGKGRRPVSEYVYPPVNGVPIWIGGITNGVVKVE